MALDTLYTSPTYDAYSDVATMDTAITNIVLLGGGTDGGWSTLDATGKETFIKHATKNVDGMNFKGTRNVDIVEPNRTQPRDGLYFPDGSEVPDDVVQPEIVNYMACFIVGTMVSNENASTNTAGIKKKKVGDVEIEYLSSDQSANFITDVDTCASKQLPSDWYISELVLGGIGTVGMTRIP